MRDKLETRQIELGSLRMGNTGVVPRVIYIGRYSLAEAACRTGGKRKNHYRLPQAQLNTGKHSQDTGRHRYSTGWHSQKKQQGVSM